MKQYAVLVQWKTKYTGYHRKAFYNLSGSNGEMDTTTTDLSWAKDRVRFLRESDQYESVTLVEIKELSA
jgi:hypothetical protein